MRLDVALVEWGLVQTRARAKDLIGRGQVSLGGQSLNKPNRKMRDEDRLALRVQDFPWVSRSALKLAGALDHFFTDGGRQIITGTYGIDIGASTGGFSQVLLERGASHVTALDVGHGQLHESLAENAKITNLEGLNARHLSQKHVDQAPQIVVSDVSFISLKLALPPAMALAAPGAHLFALVKPQFEIGKGQLGKGGVVRDRLVRDAVVLELSEWFADQSGWTVRGQMDSPINGPDGNQEAVVWAQKDSA